MARMVTEEAFDRLKSRFIGHHKKCKIEKKTVKVMALACVVLHIVSIERRYLILSVFDLN